MAPSVNLAQMTYLVGYSLALERLANQSAHHALYLG